MAPSRFAGRVAVRAEEVEGVAEDVDLREAEVTVRGLAGAVGVDTEAVGDETTGVAAGVAGLEGAGWSKLLKKSSSDGGGLATAAVEAPSTYMASGNLRFDCQRHYVTITGNTHCNVSCSTRRLNSALYRSATRPVYFFLVSESDNSAAAP